MCKTDFIRNRYSLSWLTERRNSKQSIEINVLTALSCFQIHSSSSITAELSSRNHLVASGLSSAHPTLILQECESYRQRGQTAKLCGCLAAGNRSLIQPPLRSRGETPAFALEGEQSHRSQQHSSHAQWLPFSCLFVFFFPLTKVTRTTSGKQTNKKPEAEMDKKMACYCKNIKRK